MSEEIVNGIKILIEKGLACEKNNDFHGALGHYRHAVYWGSGTIWLWERLGFVAVQLQLYDAAVIYVKNLINLDPNNYLAHYNHAKISLFLQDYAQAEQHLKWLIGFDDTPDTIKAEVHLKLAVLYRDKHEKDLSLHHIAICEKYAHTSEFYRQRMFSYLKFGDYNQGLAFYEQRGDENLQLFPQPIFQTLAHHDYNKYYQGEDLADKTLLVSAEQGYGDCIFWARFIPKIAEYCQHLIVEIYPALFELFKQRINLPNVSFIRRAIDIPQFDFWLRMGSLPYGLECEFDQLPICEDIFKWQDAPIIIPMTQNIKNIGLVWQNNALSADNFHRSVDLSQFINLLNCPNCQFFSLQKNGTNEIKSLKLQYLIQDCAPLMSDFLETAKIISKLDLIITIDSVVAHLAASMAKPVWLLLNYGADWRYGIGDISPWYPQSQILFRKNPNDEWRDIIKEIKSSLLAL